MSDVSTFSSATAAAFVSLSARTDKELNQAASTASENGKIDQSAKDFESILLGTWLQQAEQSFAALPGAEEDGDADAGKDQYLSIAMQSLGSSMTADGGIGISKMIARQLHKTEDARTGHAAQS